MEETIVTKGLLSKMTITSNKEGGACLVSKNTIKKHRYCFCCISCYTIFNTRFSDLFHICMYVCIFYLQKCKHFI